MRPWSRSQNEVLFFSLPSAARGGSSEMLSERGMGQCGTTPRAASTSLAPVPCRPKQKGGGLRASNTLRCAKGKLDKTQFSCSSQSLHFLQNVFYLPQISSVNRSLPSPGKVHMSAQQTTEERGKETFAHMQNPSLGTVSLS